jgi:hypothetical protein
MMRGYSKEGGRAGEDWEKEKWGCVILDVEIGF